MKKIIFLLSFLVVVCVSVFSQVSDEIRQELIELYTRYAQSRTGTERLQYIRNPDSYKKYFRLVLVIEKLVIRL